MRRLWHRDPDLKQHWNAYPDEDKVKFLEDTRDATGEAFEGLYKKQFVRLTRGLKSEQDIRRDLSDMSELRYWLLKHAQAIERNAETLYEIVERDDRIQYRVGVNQRLVVGVCHHQIYRPVSFGNLNNIVEHHPGSVPNHSRNPTINGNASIHISQQNVLTAKR